MSEDEYKYRLAKYLLDYDPSRHSVADIDANEYKIRPSLYSDEQLIAEINEIIQKIKPFARPGLAGFHSYVSQRVELAHKERQEKHELLEHHHVYDSYLLSTLKEFLIITIALLIKLERMHKKGILCGNINPYTFLYSKKRKECEPVDLGVVLSDKNIVRAEQQLYGPYIYLTTNLASISYTKYLAPELRESVRAYHLQKRLRELAEEAKKRNIAQPQTKDIEVLLRDLHQRKVRYTNRAEIYSVGYTINQILSHCISKLAHYGLRMNEFVAEPVDPKVIQEAELLLPDSFANPLEERVLALVNEAVQYTYDLMHEHIEKRDSLEDSIEKFVSLLKRSSLTKPDDILGEEEEKSEELEFLAILEELEHAHKHGEHAEHEHGEHEHEGHEHGEHEHEGHEHGEHEHEGHEHGEHEHEGHEHGEHEHEGHEHGEHEGHEHGEHEHEGHEHGEHEHEGHEHGEHGHAGHEDHEDHEHGTHEHEGHEHGEHEEHEHGEHEHEGHEDHDEHAGHDAHEEHASHDQHEEGHSDHAGHEAHSEHAQAHDMEHGDHKEHVEGTEHGEHKSTDDHKEPDPSHGDANVAKRGALKRPGRLK